MCHCRVTLVLAPRPSAPSRHRRVPPRLLRRDRLGVSPPQPPPHPWVQPGSSRAGGRKHPWHFHRLIVPTTRRLGGAQSSFPPTASAKTGRRQRVQGPGGWWGPPALVIPLRRWALAAIRWQRRFPAHRCVGVPVTVHGHQLQRGECQLGRTHRVPALGRVPGCSCGAPRCPVTRRGWCRTPGAGRGFGDAAGGPAARTGAEGSRSPCRLPAGGEMPWEGAGPARLGVGSRGASEPKAEAAPARPAWPGWQLPATGALPLPGAVPGLLPLQIFKAPAPRRRLPRPLPRCPPACPRAPGASCLRRHRHHGEEPVTLCRGWWLSPGMLAGVRLGSGRSCGSPGDSGGASARLRGCRRLGDAGADAVGRGRWRRWGDAGGRCVTEHGSGGVHPIALPWEVLAVPGRAGAGGASCLPSGPRQQPVPLGSRCSAAMRCPGCWCRGGGCHGGSSAGSCHGPQGSPLQQGEFLAVLSGSLRSQQRYGISV